MSDKTVAERLRDECGSFYTICGIVNRIVRGNICCTKDGDCKECASETLNALADMIVAEQAELRKQSGVDVDALLKLADLFSSVYTRAKEVLWRYEASVEPDTFKEWADTIRNAVKGAKPQLPEGVEWPRFESGELVRFGDIAKVRDDIGEVIEIRFYTGKCSEVTIAFEDESTATHYMVIDGPRLKRPEPDVRDADGAPIKVGDTVYALGKQNSWRGEMRVITVGSDIIELEGDTYTSPCLLTHRKPDTQEAIDEDCWLDAKDYCEKHNVKTEWPKHYGKAKCEHLLARQRKLLGGE